MAHAGSDSSDPYLIAAMPFTGTFACKTHDRCQLSLLTDLDREQVALIALADTETIPNPFANLSVTDKVSVYLCTSCRDKYSKWQVLCISTRYGSELAARALRKWQRRCVPDVLGQGYTVCFIFSTTGQVHLQSKEVGNRANQMRKPTPDWTLFTVSSDMRVARTTFMDEMCRLSDCDVTAVEELLSDPFVHHLFYFHLNHSRIAQERAIYAENAVHGQNCIFAGHECSSITNSKINYRLWKVDTIDVQTLEDMEDLSQFYEDVMNHSNNHLYVSDVKGRYSYRSCLYIIFQGRCARKPNVHVA